MEKQLSIITDMTIGTTTNAMVIESAFSVLLSSISQLIKPNPDKPEKILQFLHISSTIKKNVGGCVHVTYR